MRSFGALRADYKSGCAMRSLALLLQGQGTRPPPVADEGSVSWRSGQICAK